MAARMKRKISEAPADRSPMKSGISSPLAEPCMSDTRALLQVLHPTASKLHSIASVMASSVNPDAHMRSLVPLLSDKTWEVRLNARSLLEACARGAILEPNGEGSIPLPPELNASILVPELWALVSDFHSLSETVRYARDILNDSLSNPRFAQSVSDQLLRLFRSSSSTGWEIDMMCHSDMPLGVAVNTLEALISASKSGDERVGNVRYGLLADFWKHTANLIDAKQHSPEDLAKALTKPIMQELALGTLHHHLTGWNDDAAKAFELAAADSSIKSVTSQLWRFISHPVPPAFRASIMNALKAEAGRDKAFRAELVAKVADDFRTCGSPHRQAEWAVELLRMGNEGRASLVHDFFGPNPHGMNDVAQYRIIELAGCENEKDRQRVVRFVGAGLSSAYSKKAVALLGELPAAAPVLEIKPQLLKALTDTNTQATTAMALGKWGRQGDCCASLFEGFKPELRSAEFPGAMRGQIAYLWAGLVMNKASREVALGSLDGLLAETNPRLRSAAVVALGRCGSKEAVGDVMVGKLQLMKDKDPDHKVRSDATWALGKLNGPSQKPATTPVPPEKPSGFGDYSI
jgi:hypothetical protein